MLKKTVAYTDFNDQSQTEDLYFHLSEPELMELEYSHPGGMLAAMQKAVDDGDGGTIMNEVKNLILKAYGKKSEDGRRFIKNPVLQEEFENSKAYSTLFMELVTNPDAAAKFIQGIIPQDLAKRAAELARSNGNAGPELGYTAAAQAEQRRSVVPQRMKTSTLRELPEDEFHATMERVKKGEIELID